MITAAKIKENPQIRTYVEAADATLKEMGYTEHSFAHVTRVAHVAEKILADLGYPARLCELAWIAGYMHAQSGAVMAFRILDKLGMPADEIAVICSAIGNHDESTAYPVNEVAAALILADKTDVRRTRVRTKDRDLFDIHDRVNYSVEKASTRFLPEQKEILLELTIDTEISPVPDYFEIFMDRMLLCRKAAKRLGLNFRLEINGQKIL